MTRFCYRRCFCLLNANRCGRTIRLPTEAVFLASWSAASLLPSHYVLTSEFCASICVFSLYSIIAVPLELPPILPSYWLF
ncbi:hypothetical protein L211DRAFT_835411 [Terfezia boudieri ATCC MYA-4762]|uniref:Uncharacterized protein n=1 Tax=Terfezia boudieri ATCC MYA-4762 TaxID=1051890 RepID=A0A3N4LUM3_9PEZI|nr:hypothetical protein L211DRAFT_835411 [Terfezia boudieri ATCC MYA-4762]